MFVRNFIQFGELQFSGLICEKKSLYGGELRQTQH